MSGPNANGRIQTASGHFVAVESDGVDLMVMALEDMQAFSRVDIPKLGRRKSIRQHSRQKEKQLTKGEEGHLPDK